MIFSNAGMCLSNSDSMSDLCVATLYCSIVVWRILLQDNLLLKLTIFQGTGRESPTTFLLHLFQNILKNIICWHRYCVKSNLLQRCTANDTHTHTVMNKHTVCVAKVLAPKKYLIFIWYVALWLAKHIAHCQGELQLDLDDIFGPMHNIRDYTVWVMIEYNTCAVAVCCLLLDTDCMFP